MSNPSDRPRATDSRPELALLKALQQRDRQQVAALTLGRRVDFDTLADFLVSGRMGVYAHACLLENKLQALLPRRVAEPIRQQYEVQQQRNRQLVGMLAAVQQLLDSAGIELMVMKGLPLAERFWGGPARRFSMDLDLMVRREQFSDAVKVLTGAGYSRPAGVPGAHRLALQVSHALELTRDGLSLDLHWTLRNRPGLCFQLDVLWQASRRCRLPGVDCRTLSDSDQLLILLLGLANDIERGHHRLRSFWDIYLVLLALDDMDWNAFLKQQGEQGLSAMLMNLLALVLQHLDCRDELPGLAEVIDEHSAELVIASPGGVDELLSRPPQSPGNRYWFARLLPSPAWQYWTWMAATLPARFLLGRHI